MTQQTDRAQLESLVARIRWLAGDIKFDPVYGRYRMQRVLLRQAADAIEALTAPSDNERLAFEHLSKALTGGNASTWDELFHAADALTARDAGPKQHEDYDWAHERVTRMAASACADASVYGKKLLAGIGYPDEVFRAAQDARALTIILESLPQRVRGPQSKAQQHHHVTPDPADPNRCLLCSPGYDGPWGIHRFQPAPNECAICASAEAKAAPAPVSGEEPR